MVCGSHLECDEGVARWWVEAYVVRGRKGIGGNFPGDEQDRYEVFVWATKGLIWEGD